MPVSINNNLYRGDKGSGWIKYAVLLLLMKPRYIGLSHPRTNRRPLVLQLLDTLDTPRYRRTWDRCSLKSISFVGVSHRRWDIDSRKSIVNNDFEWRKSSRWIVTTSTKTLLVASGLVWRLFQRATPFDRVQRRPRENIINYFCSIDARINGSETKETSSFLAFQEIYIAIGRSKYLVQPFRWCFKFLF